MTSTVFAAMSDRLVVAGGAGDDWTTAERLTDRSRLECALAADDRLFVGTFEDGLLRSDDGGETWERVGAESIESAAVMSLAADPSDPSVLWAGTEPSAVYRSTDGGDTWTHVGGLTAMPSSDEWAFPPRPHTHHVRWIEVAPDDPDRVYVGVEAGALLYTTDGGDTWHERPPGSRRDNHTLATHPDAPDRVYSAAGDGYAESHDRGESWGHPQTGLDHRYVWGLAVDAGDPDRVLVASAHGASDAHRPPGDAHLYRLTGDRGPGGTDARWERLDDCGVPTGEGALRAVLASPAAGEFYACNDRGLYRSADGGDTFDELVAFGEELRGTTCRGLAIPG